MSIRDYLHIDRLWSRAPVVAVLRFEGVIMSRARRDGVSLASHAAAIERAFRVSNLVAVAVVINSPGGSSSGASASWPMKNAFRSSPLPRMWRHQGAIG